MPRSRAIRDLVYAVWMLLAGCATAVLARPMNDDLADRIALHGEEAAFDVDLTGATQEIVRGDDGREISVERLFADIVQSCRADPNRVGTAWWEWTAPRDGTVVVLAERTSDQETLPAQMPQVAVSRRPWEPTSARPLLVGNVPDPIAFSEHCTDTVRYAFSGFHARQGETFLIQASGEDWFRGRFRLRMTGGPVIFEPPVDRTLRVGESSFLNVVATGHSRLDPFLGRWLEYQWMQNGVALPGEQFASLLLTNVVPSNAGDYQVVVTDSEGSVTSAVARVSITDREEPPSLEVGFESSGGSGGRQVPRWTLVGEPGRFYVLESSTNLLDWAWQPVQPTGPMPDEPYCVTGGKWMETASHVMLASGRFPFRPAFAPRTVFLRARRVQPLVDERIAGLWILELAKEEFWRANLARASAASQAFGNDLYHLMPRAVSHLAFDGDNDCHVSVLVRTFIEPAIWPCLGLNDESLRDPYWMMVPSPVWNAR